MRAGACSLLLLCAAPLACGHPGARGPGETRARERDELSALWSLYRYTHVHSGRVVAADEGGITTSEGQAYAMLRAVWASYAWNGDADRALAHGAIAERRGRAAPSDAELARSLRRGREPALAGGTRVLAQPGGAFPLSSLAAFASGSADPTPFTTSAVEGGLAFHRGGGAHAEGTHLAAAGEWRPRRGDRLRLGLAWDGARLCGREAGGELRWEQERGDLALSLRAARVPRRDSFRALAGERVGDVRVGAASEDLGEIRVGLTSGRDRLELTARAGAVSGAGFRAVFTAGASGRADREVLRRGVWRIRLGAAAEATHHARDLSGLHDADALAPRLFSPPLFLAASPRVVVAPATRSSGPSPRRAPSGSGPHARAWCRR